MSVVYHVLEDKLKYGGKSHDFSVTDHELGDEYTWFGLHPLLPGTVAKALNFVQEQPGYLDNTKLWEVSQTDGRPAKCSTGDLSGQTVNICATGYLYAGSKQYLRIDPREAHSTEQHRSDSAQGLLGVDAPPVPDTSPQQSVTLP